MKLNKSSSSLLTMAIAVGVAVFASLPLTAVAATWTNQAGGYWLDTNNWLNYLLPSGGGTSGAADFSASDWTTTGELVVSTDLTPVSTNTAIPRFRNILFNDTGAAPDAVLKFTGTNALTFYNSTAGSHPWIAPNGSTVVRMDVGIEVDPANTNSIQINCGDNTSKVYLDKKQTSISYIRMTRGGLYLNAGNNTLPTNTIVMMDGTTAEWFALNGTTQEVAGLVATSDNSRRIINDNATTGQLIVNVPAGTTYSFRGRIGYGGSGSYNEQSTFGVIKRGAGIQFINRQISSFTGPMVIEEGVLAIDNDGNDGPGTDPSRGTLGSTSGDTTVNAGATLNIQGLSAIFLEPLVLKGDGVGGITGFSENLELNRAMQRIKAVQRYLFICCGGDGPDTTAVA